MQPQINSVNVCTYNIGANVGDYMLLCKHINPKMTFKSKEEEQSFRDKYERIQLVTAVALKGIADVYCLQEVGDDQRPIVLSLLAADYSVVHCEGLHYFDSVIAINNKRFKSIINHSFKAQITPNFHKDVAIATATEIQTGQKVCFVSGHAPGCDLTKPIRADEAIEGDDYCKLIAHRISVVATDAIQIVGMDMNVNPEKWNPRFTIFTEQGLVVNRVNAVTNVNSRDSSYKEREIDFFFVKFANVSRVFKAAAIDFDVEKNCSDHIPVCMTVAIPPKKQGFLKKWFA